MATIYFDTETKQYSALNWLRIFEWNKQPDHSHHSRLSQGIWVAILGYLDDQSINMRKVSKFFLDSNFRSIYEDSPICLQSAEAKPNFQAILKALFLRNYVITNVGISLVPDERNLKTNFHLAGQPASSNNLESLFSKSECDEIIQQMPKVRAISTLYYKGQDEYESGFPYHLISKIVTFDEVPRWDVITKFKALQALSCYFNREHYFLRGPDENTLPRLCSLELIARTDRMPLDLNAISTILKAVPNLERLYFEREAFRSLSGALTLEPVFFKHLQRLELVGLDDMKAADWVKLFMAVPHLRELILRECNGFEEGLFQLAPRALRCLKEVELSHHQLSLLAFNALFSVAPDLTKMKLVYDIRTWVSLEYNVFQQVCYPSIRDFCVRFHSINLKVSKKGIIDSLLPMIERMPNLESLIFENCIVEKKDIDADAFGAYSHLNSFKALDSIVDSSYSTAIIQKQSQ